MKKIDMKRQMILYTKREKRRLHRIRNVRKYTVNKKADYTNPSPQNNWTKTIKIPKNFSLYDDPNNVIDFALSIDNIKKEDRVSSLFYDFIDCDEMDLAASTIIDVFSVKKISELKAYKSQDLKINGLNSKNRHVNMMMDSNGIKKHLGFVHDSFGTDEINYSFIDLLIGGKKTHYLKVNDKLESSKASTKIVEFYDLCLRKHGYALSIEGERTISSLTTEVIDNCVLHANPDNKPEYGNQWFVNAFHRRINDFISSISIVIMNFGESIYKGIKSLVTQQNLDPIQLEMKSKLIELSNKNETWLTNRLTEETLYTLYALQEGVSRKRSLQDMTRGMGTISLIETFQNLGDSIREEYNSKMCLVSGKTCIKFDNRYRIQKSLTTNRKIIAFNKENDLFIQPDKRNVFSLKKGFPGTIISMDFYFDSQYIDKIANNGGKLDGINTTNNRD